MKSLIYHRLIFIISITFISVLLFFEGYSVTNIRIIKWLFIIAPILSFGIRMRFIRDEQNQTDESYGSDIIRGFIHLIFWMITFFYLIEIGGINLKNLMINLLNSKYFILIIWLWLMFTFSVGFFNDRKKIPTPNTNGIGDYSNSEPKK